MCLRAVDRFYDAVADDLGQADAPWFVEKLLPSHLQWIAWEIYADVREIVLVRDFRDVVCSARAFNQRRRHLAFGRERAASDEQWIRNMAEGGVRRLWTAWQRRSDRAHLVRYEDLVRDPHATLGRVFEYVGVDASDTVVAGVLERAGRESEETRDHRTTATGRESIGRWRRDLDEPLAEVAQAAMGPALKAFGYDD